MGFTLTAYAQTPKHTETVVLNGMDTYYEVYGEGTPLLFLHGGGQSSALWHEYVNDFADNFEVYLVDLPAHGKSSNPQGGFSYEIATDQLRDFFEHLKIQQFSAIGYSLGAEELLHYAATNHGQINRMVLVGGAHRYQRRNEDEIDFYLAEDDVKRITAETLIVIGESDTTIGGNITDKFDLVIQLHELLPKSHIWIVPNERHRTFDGAGKPEFVRNANEFLSGKWE